MCRRILVLAMVSVFVLGTSFVFAQDIKGKQGPTGRRVTKIDRINIRVAKLTRELNLTVKQQSEVKQILTKARDDAKVILQEANAKVKEIRIKAHDEIKTLLTEEQKKKFQEIRQKHETVPEVKE